MPCEHTGTADAKRANERPTSIERGHGKHLGIVNPFLIYPWHDEHSTGDFSCFTEK